MKMFKYFVFLMLSAACSAHCNVTSSTCMQKESYNSNLDLALDLIIRAKYTLPKVPEDWFPKALDCADVFQMGHEKSGIYEIWPMNRLTEGIKSISVYCDMDTDGGGWTVIQRRGDFGRPMDYFYKDWKSYKEGFGDRSLDFWIGNDNIFALTNQKLYSVRFDLKDFGQNKRYALYDTFWIDDEDHNYVLHISDYSGDAGDSMTSHNNAPFTTKDRDNDYHGEKNCAARYEGAWWYKECHNVDLNGLYHNGIHGNSGEGIMWRAFKGDQESLEWTEIKIRPKYARNSFASGLTHNL